jgi:thiol-disulfide isomerase/thioredoxin
MLAFALIVLVAVIGAILTTTRSSQESTAPGFSAAALQQPAPPVNLSEFRGRPVVLNFFASWCPPCTAELPTLAAAQRRVGDRVAFVGIDVSDTTSSAIDLVKRSGVAYPVGTDPDYKVSNGLYHLRGLPSTVFVDANGRVNATVLGQLSPQVLDQRLGQLSPQAS